MTISLFTQKTPGAARPETMLSRLVVGIHTHLQNEGNGMFVTPTVSKAALESADPVKQLEVASDVERLSHALENILETHHVYNGVEVTNKPNQAQRIAGIAAAIMGSDIKTFLSQPSQRDFIATESATDKYTFIKSNGGVERLKAALEAYDERDNKNAITYSVAYNMQAARQDEFGEAFFPTVVVTPDQPGLTVSIRLIQVYDELRRPTSGATNNDMGRRNIIEAVVDPTILQNDTTNMVPVVRTESQSLFVDPALLAPKNIVLPGSNEVVTTSAIAINSRYDFLGLTQTQSLLDTGLQDSTDSIDTALYLQNLYISVTQAAAGGNPAVTEVFSFNVEQLPYATWNYAPQNNYRIMQLAFNNNALLINGATTTVAGAASTVLAAVASGHYAVRLAVNVGGTCNLQTGETQLFSSPLSVYSVTDENGNVLDLTTGNGLVIANLFSSAAVIGYDLKARRSNLNRRMRGQLLDVTFYNQIYSVPLLAPITVPRPLTSSDINDSSDLAALITTTHIRTSNAAVAALLNAGTFLQEYINSADSIESVPEILGLARYLVTPFYESDSIDVAASLDSLKSSDRVGDIQSLLINKIRDIAYRMYQFSNYKAAADALAGGVAPMPTVIIGTDPYISRYLMVNGDFRTLGNDFHVKVVSTLNITMRGKIAITFGQFDGASEGVPNPMHFGNMAWKPEMTLVLPLHRNGANSKELTVQPSFLHIVNLPILALLTVTNIPSVVASKVQLDTHSV